MDRSGTGKLTGELANYLERIEDLRGQMAGLVAGLPTQALNWRPFQGEGDLAANSLAALVAHSAGAERFWIVEVVGGHPAARNRAAEFAEEASSSMEIIGWLADTARQSSEVFAGLSDADLDSTRRTEGHILPVRWCLLHVIDHTALHVGHMQITRQLWAGGKSFPSPLWSQRLPRTDES
jgi:uncharacterized damage-inducible protein DinB